jgi:hypothetical protein
VRLGASIFSSQTVSLSALWRMSGVMPIAGIAIVAVSVPAPIIHMVQEVYYASTRGVLFDAAGLIVHRLGDW